MVSRRLRVLTSRLAVCRLGPEEPIPPWATGGSLFSVTRTPAELSIVCAEERVPPGVRAERGFRAFEVVGPIDFSATGVLSSLAEPLASAGISIFSVSTFDTDTILVKEDSLERALSTLESAGHQVERPA